MLFYKKTVGGSRSPQTTNISELQTYSISVQCRVDVAIYQIRIDTSVFQTAT